MPFLFFKGYHALQSYRAAHWLWQQGRECLALFLQNRISQVFDVDIHPGARIGRGVMIDHATGVVIGETVVLEDNVSMLHGVTLGGSGCGKGDRHPKIRAGVLIGVGAKILGNIEIGEGAKIGAGSVVLDAVAAHTTVAGVPAKLIGRPRGDEPSRDMDHHLD
jgi:serine O-acetyltransferase